MSDSNYDAVLKQRIKHIRKSSNLSQMRFATMLGVSIVTMNNVENGKIPPSDALILRICLKFRINKDWLYFGVGNMYASRHEKRQEYKEIASEIEQYINNKPKMNLKDISLTIDSMRCKYMLVFQNENKYQEFKEKIIKNVVK